MNKFIYILLIKLALRLHNIIYKLIACLAIKAENGLHPKHRLMNYHQFFLSNITKGDKVLDVGCGNGALTFDLSKKAGFITGIDLGEQNIKAAKNRFNAENIEYRTGDATKNLDNQFYDVVVLSNVLEHLSNRSEFLKKLRGSTSKILIRVPMIDRAWVTLYKKELEVEWRLDKTHVIEYSLASFHEELKEGGLNLDKHTIQFGEIWAVAS